MIGVLMSFVALTLAVVSPLHLTGALGGGAKPFDPTSAGIAEAAICVVLALGAFGLLHDASRWWGAAIGAVMFAVFGFLVGLVFTVSGGDAIDIAYHATVLPLLLVTLALLSRHGRPTTRARLGAPSYADAR
jgi:hypothetical protein